jgi:D-glycero-D-manno-heptose 1,7-bisphosphate phosphatase
MAAPRRAVFLDRDGTLLDETGYLADPGELKLLDGIAAALRRLRQGTFFLCVATNQSGIARGLFDEADLDRVHRRMQEELAAAGVSLDAILHCPHHPDHGSQSLRKRCLCRKPAPGMLLEAASRFGLDLPNSWSIGDSGRDLEASRRAGVPGRILVLTGKGKATLNELSAAELEGTRVVPNLATAVETILTADTFDGKGLRST